jgi:hypothetical protein
VNDAKTTKSLALVNTLSTAKSLFVADPATTETNIQSFNSSTGDSQGNNDTQFAFIAQYIRVNGAVPTNEANLLQLSGIPAAGVTITLGTVDDAASGTPDSPPMVTGYP